MTQQARRILRVMRRHTGKPVVVPRVGAAGSKQAADASEPRRTIRVDRSAASREAYLPPRAIMPMRASYMRCRM